MENTNHKGIAASSSKVWAGAIIIIVGALLLFRNFGISMPSYIFHWSNILILIGLFIGIKHNFRNGNGLVLIIVGGFFTLKEALENVVDFDKVGWPILIIVLGLFLIFKPRNQFKEGWKKRFKSAEPQNFGDDSFASESKKKRDNDFLDSTNVFGGSHQTVYSKNFKGGEITAVFGGCDVNLTQADFEGEVVLDVTAIFGGAKIIVPTGWQVKHEVTAIFGGLDDKRPIMMNTEDKTKILVVKGIALFGGVDIRSY
ncbi:MAG: hypothetical protein EOO87_05760 [Pedobacter sp.]|nr:MAG: hypothetical protein EOO87_05760 [Pedobacter sp.]